MNSNFILALACIALCLCLGCEQTNGAAVVRPMGRNNGIREIQAPATIDEKVAEEAQLEDVEGDKNDDELAESELDASESSDGSPLEVEQIEEQSDVEPVHGNLRRARRPARRGRKVRKGRKGRRGGRKSRRGRKNRKGGRRIRRGRKNRKAKRVVRRRRVNKRRN